MDSIPDSTEAQSETEVNPQPQKKPVIIFQNNIDPWADQASFWGWNTLHCVGLGTISLLLAFASFNQVYKSFHEWLDIKIRQSYRNWDIPRDY